MPHGLLEGVYVVCVPVWFASLPYTFWCVAYSSVSRSQCCEVQCNEIILFKWQCEVWPNSEHSLILLLSCWACCCVWMVWVILASVLLADWGCCWLMLANSLVSRIWLATMISWGSCYKMKGGVAGSRADVLNEGECRRIWLATMISWWSCY
jgi:hypothetical protein